MGIGILALSNSRLIWLPQRGPIDGRAAGKTFGGRASRIGIKKGR
jgi:hypothetical protein